VLAGCSSATSGPTTPTPIRVPLSGHHETFATFASFLAKQDHRRPVRATYLTPLHRLHQRCLEASPNAVAGVVSVLGFEIRKLRAIGAPFAAAEAAMSAGAHLRTDCGALGDAIGKEVGGRLNFSGSLYSGFVRFSPTLTADLALASIRSSLLPGTVRVVYALKAFSCQQAIFMGPALGRKYRNSSEGAFVELTSGKGVGHGKYDANRVNRARITPLGRIGGQPCT
jgi:hypothetical protein